jgi:outer membrane protein assembly factor BamA
MSFKIIILSIFVLFIYTMSQAQNDSLPFPISEKRRLSDQRLESKKEGWYVTGLPRLGYDPIQGIGIGADGEIFNNRTADDPFFAYTPYRERITFSVGYTQFGKVSAGLGLDMPYFLNTKWRVRAKFSFSDNPNKIYFTPGESSLKPLSYVDRITGETVTNARYDDYRRALSVIRPMQNPWDGEIPGVDYTDRNFHYNRYTKYALDIIVERTYMEGDLRLVFAGGVIDLRYNPYDFEQEDRALDKEGNRVEATNGLTLITRDFSQAERGDPNSYWVQNNITGYEGGFSVKFKAGLIYDTRDFEPDPTRGTLLEYSLGYTAPWIGSDFHYSRHQLQWMQFQEVLHFLPNKNILSSRLMLSTIGGPQVFFREVFDIWSASQGRIGVLGGEDTMRGFKKFRFGGMAMGMGNIELRSRVTSFSWANQDFEISAVPFFDFGRVWDGIEQINLRGFKYNPGLGVRIAWNQSTILRFDYARSAEDSQFFFVFGQIF